MKARAREKIDFRAKIGATSHSANQCFGKPMICVISAFVVISALDILLVAV